MNDDFNSPILISHLFEGVRIINSINDGKGSLVKDDIELLKSIFKIFVTEILGLVSEEKGAGQDTLVSGLVDTLIQLRQEAKANNDFAAADNIRDTLLKLGVQVKDTKDGAVWHL